MSSYADQAEIHQLCAEREIVSRSMDWLNNGGYLASISVAPPPGQMMIAVGGPVYMPPPTPPATIAQITNVLRDRLRDIDARLKALGVTDLPPSPGTGA